MELVQETSFPSFCPDQGSSLSTGDPFSGDKTLSVWTAPAAGVRAALLVQVLLRPLSEEEDWEASFLDLRAGAAEHTSELPVVGVTLPSCMAG